MWHGVPSQLYSVDCQYCFFFATFWSAQNVHTHFLAYILSNLLHEPVHLLLLILCLLISKNEGYYQASTAQHTNLRELEWKPLASTQWVHIQGGA